MSVRISAAGCDRLIIWKWFCAHTDAWPLCIALTLLRVFLIVVFFFLNLQMLLLPAWYFFCFLFLFFFFNLLSLPLLSSFPFWLVEDVSNLTASDVMNRVNLGYLQGNLCAVYNSFATCEWLRPPCGERNLSFRQHPMKNSICPPKRMLNCRCYLISLVI